MPIAAGQSQESLLTINGLLKAGECVCLFPEGAISRNGHLGKFHTGYERTLDGVENGAIVPFYLHGLWGSSLSRADDGLRDAQSPDLKRDLIVAFGPPLPLETTSNQLKQKVFELSITAWQTYTKQLDPVPLAWLRATRRRPARCCIADDSRAELTNYQMVAVVAGLSQQLKLPAAARHVGVLLPTSAQAAQAIMALLLQGRVAMPLNHTIPAETLRAVLCNSSVQQVITSRAFQQTLSATGIEIELLLKGHDIVYMEDLARGSTGWRRMLTTLQYALLPTAWFYRLRGNLVEADQPAAILLSDNVGTEPEVVLLSHRNIMTNSKQMSDVLNTHLDDVVVSCAPLYHPMGLVLTTIMPLVEGIPVACHADPSDALGIAKSIARHGATVFPSVPATLDLCTRSEQVHPLMLESLWLVVSGSEPLPPEVREQFELKFGKRIYQGYGLAETTTGATVNIPDGMDTSDWKVQRGSAAGTMGMPLPGTSLKIVDEHSGKELPLGQAGQLLICGSQVMLGYLNKPEKTTGAIVELDGMRWFRTGRTGRLTEEGFLVLA